MPHQCGRCQPLTGVQGPRTGVGQSRGDRFTDRRPVDSEVQARGWGLIKRWEEFDLFTV